MTAPNTQRVPNYNNLQAFVDAETAGVPQTGTHTGDTVSLILNDLTTASQANKAGVPSNPATPSVPTSGTAVTNTQPYAVNVSVTGGTVTAIAVNGTATGLDAGNFVVPSGGTITLTYSAAPTWVWTNAGGVAGYVEVLVDGTVQKLSFYAA